MGRKIAVAMSGGVDSSTCALLLKEQGFEVTGLFMDLGQADIDAQVRRVSDLGRKIGVRVEVVDLAAVFAQKVKAYFRAAYEGGLTPNPCVVCNREIKFGRLLAYARGLGAQSLATGHYVRIESDSGRIRLMKGVDGFKDQSYFLCALSSATLAGCTFPLGGYCKDQVYDMALARGLDFTRSQESQDVCFLAGCSLADYLARDGLASRPGDIVDKEGEVLGRHQGSHLYTIGQRRGLGVPAASPLYVTGLDPVANRVIVGEDHDLWRDRCRVARLNWLAGAPPREGLVLEVKIRSRQQPIPARLTAGDDGEEIIFSTSQRAITPGQFAAFYNGEELLGGAEIIG